MRTYIYASTMLTFAAALSACSGSQSKNENPLPSKSAHHTVILDVSASSAAMGDVVLSDAVQHRITTDLKKSVKLGDSIRYYEAGARNADRMVARLNLVTGYGLRVPAALTKLAEAMSDTATRFRADGGDGGTNLLLAMEAIQPDCSPGSTLTMESDGIEESEAYSTTAALNAGGPVNLPAPSSRYLTGCRVRFIALGLTGGMTGQHQLLPANQLDALRKGWSTYLKAAGVEPDAIEFVSAL